MGNVNSLNIGRLFSFLCEPNFVSKNIHGNIGYWLISLYERLENLLIYNKYW